MIIQFLLKLIFFYFLYTFMRSILRGYLQKKAMAGAYSQNTGNNTHQERRTKHSASSADIFEAEYKVVKEEN